MTEKDSKAYMYVVECADGTLYTGYTTDVERRLKTHNAGKGERKNWPISKNTRKNNRVFFGLELSN